MEFRQLEYFCTISELENFTKTAQVLHVSQPSVTKAIKSLESELQLTLIDRSQKHISLTEEGKAFLLHAQRIMQDVETAKQDMQRFHVNPKETIHFGIPPMVEAYLFPDFFTKFRQSYPEVALDVQEFNDSTEVRSRAELGELDFGIVMGEPKEAAQNEYPVMHDCMSLCLSTNHALAEKETVEFSLLQNEKFIMQQPATYQYRKVYAHCTEAGFTPDVVLCTSQIKTIKQLVANGIGVSVLPDFVTRNDKSFLRRDLSPSIGVQVSLYWGTHKIFSSVDYSFLEFIKNYTKSADFKRNFRQA